MQSRIDCNYTTTKIIKTAVDWEVTTTALTTDHKMVSVKIMDQKAPYIGRGRWTMLLHMLKDKNLISEIQCLGKELEEKLDNAEQRSTVINPQVHFQSSKNEIIRRTRERAKVAVQIGKSVV